MGEVPGSLCTHMHPLFPVPIITTVWHQRDAPKIWPSQSKKPKGCVSVTSRMVLDKQVHYCLCIKSILLILRGIASPGRHV